jgi:hypothetical protein
MYPATAIQRESMVGGAERRLNLTLARWPAGQVFVGKRTRHHRRSELYVGFA